MNEMQRPGVGTGVWIRKEGKVLLGERKSDWGLGTWAPPGGKLEMYEEWDENVLRETMEETGLNIGNVTFITVLNGIFRDQGSHYVTLYFAADWLEGEPQVKEPDKCAEWNWFDWSSLPLPLFEPTRIFVDKGYNPLKF
jgi:8-oxo-dGTP diphosphatase